MEKIEMTCGDCENFNPNDERPKTILNRYFIENCLASPQSGGVGEGQLRAHPNIGVNAGTKCEGCPLFVKKVGAN